MGTSATPKYLGDDFTDAAPGHRFSLYLPLWEQGTWQREQDRQANSRAQTPATGKLPALQSTTRLPTHSRITMASLLERQNGLANPLIDSDQMLMIQGHATAPFITGTGIDHPLENGFSFLNPYGLPYLPGSGVKGVLRSAARELQAGVFEENSKWTTAYINALFGTSEDAEKKNSVSQRGALMFWDVLPQIAKTSNKSQQKNSNEVELCIEVMTPHQAHYLQGNQSPHESGSPTPITFLTVPPGSLFCFYVQCNQAMLARLAPDLLEDKLWEALLKQAFNHAFEWLGFGAKTAVGYGAIGALSEAEVQQAQSEAAAAGVRCAWVDETVARVAKENNASDQDSLRGQALAKAWQALEDESLKQAALKDIKARWDLQGWWERPPGGATKKAKKIYSGDE